MRIKKVTGGTTTVYIYSGTKVIAEYVGGTLKTEYIYLGSQLLATIEVKPAPTPDVVTYHHNDHLSVRVNTDPTGEILKDGLGNPIGEQGHYPFGEDWDSSSTANKWGFTNYERESAAELNYATFRYDSSRLGRFMTPDPLAGSIANPQSLNRYGYVINDPINLIDPLGLDHEWVQACNPDGTGCIWVPLTHDPIKVSVSIDGGGGGGGVGGNPSGCVDIYVEGFYAGNTCQQGGMRVSEAGRGGGLLGGGGGSPFVAKGTEKARANVIKILDGDGDCAEFFGNDSKGFKNTTIVAGKMRPFTRAGGLTKDGAIAVNTNSLFFKRTVFDTSKSQIRTVSRVGQFAGGSLEAQTSILLHEYAHKKKLIPSDLGNPAQSMKNTKTIEEECGDAIKKTTKK